MKQMKYIQHINIYHPTTGEHTEVQLFELESGEILGMDKKSHWNLCDVYSPFDDEPVILEEVEEFYEVGA